MRKRFSIELAIGLVIGLVVAVLFQAGWFEKYEVKTIDDRFFLRGEVSSSAPIVLVGVTDQCLQQFQWPIERDVYARVVEKLHRWGATSVCLDVFLDSEGKGAATLVDTVRKHDTVVVPVVLEKVDDIGPQGIQGAEFTPSVTLESIDTLDPAKFEEYREDIELLKQLESGREKKARYSEHELRGIRKTYPALAEAAARRAFINVGWKEELNHDGVVRKIPLIKRIGDETFYAMALESAATHRGQTIESSGGDIYIGGQPLPLWRNFAGLNILLVNYLTGKTKFESFSFPFQALSEIDTFTDQQGAVFKDKMVIIGPAYGQTDYYLGPFKPVRGMEIHAVIGAALITGVHITRLPIPISCCLIVICAILAAACLTVESRWLSYTLAGGMIVGIAVVSQGLFNYGNLVIELIPTGLAAGTSIIIVKFYQLYLKLFLANRALTTENRRLSTLYGISSDLASTAITERKRRLDLLLNRTIAGAKADGGFLLLYDPLSEELVSELVQCVSGGGGENGDENGENGTDEVAPLMIPAGNGVLGSAVLTGRGAVFRRADLEDAVVEYIGSVCHRELESLVTVPMILGDRRPVGSINLFRATGSPVFSNDDLALVESVASQAGGVIENARLYRLATVDGLTGLYVHRHFQTRLEEELRRAVRYESQLSLMMTDIDHFKKFNDTYGHQIGDYVLKGVANILRDAVRDIDVPARYGGEEFTVILPETDLDGAYTLAERLRQSVETHTFRPPDHELHVTISIGLSNYPSAGTKHKNKLIECADTALYRAKNTGRNRTIRYVQEEPEP